MASHIVSSAQISRNNDSIHINDTIFLPNAPESNRRLNDQILAEFPGGDDSLFAFAKRNLKYPPSLIKDSIEASVYILFSINVNGIAGDVTFRSAGHPELEKECGEMINRLPRFKPAYVIARSKNGRLYWNPIKAWYSLPVFFTTNNKKSTNIKMVITP